MNKITELFKSELKIVNIGLETFYEADKDQNIKSIHVDWRPPAGGNEKLMDILEKLKNR